MGGLNAIRKKFKLKKIYANEHEEGDLSLLADIPEFNPTRFLPDHIKFIGPLTWHNNLPAPKSISKINAYQPLVYFSIGSDSLYELLENLTGLAQEGIQFIITTGGKDFNKIKLPQGIFLEDFVNADALLPYCQLVCCHGGNGTLYQALYHGLPCVSVSTHAEQAVGSKRIQELGLGLSLTLKQINHTGISRLVAAVSQVLENKMFSEKAKSFSLNFKGINGAKKASELIENHFKIKPEIESNHNFSNKKLVLSNLIN
jgi:UDP:flavonoid glycosyltransferase YjiC (YdhE family)